MRQKNEQLLRDNTILANVRDGSIHLLLGSMGTNHSHIDMYTDISDMVGELIYKGTRRDALLPESPVQQLRLFLFLAVATPHHA
jgi:hypothetical protein